GIGQRAFERPLVPAVDVDDGVGDANHVQAWEMREQPLGPRAEGQRVDSVVARDERVRLLADEVHQTVAGPDLEGLVAVSLALPREPRPAEDEEDLLVALGMQRSRALARFDTDPV